MYRMTFFLNKHPDELESLLKPIGYTKRRNSFFWRMDDSFFEVIPFSNHDRFSSYFGYRLCFNTDLGGTKYLFSLSFGLFNPKVTGLEYDLEIKKSKEEWFFFLNNSNLRFQMRDPRGIFSKEGIGLVVMGDNHVILQVRPQKPKGGIDPFQALKDIKCLLDELNNEINPETYDLFSRDLYTDERMTYSV